jgi:hypothetical protein
MKCRTPHKIRFASRDEAAAYQAQHHPRDHFMDAYECQCGGWHLGHGKDTAVLFDQPQRGRRR